MEYDLTSSRYYLASAYASKKSNLPDSHGNYTYLRKDGLGWVHRADLEVKPYLFSKLGPLKVISRTQLAEEVQIVVDKAKARGFPIVLIVHAGKNEHDYAARNGLGNCFHGLWFDMIDIQQKSRHQPTKSFISRL